jgi:hypothetical protein
VITPQFVITGDRPRAAAFVVPGKPVDFPERTIFTEVFVYDQDYNVLQLTNFHRTDTWTPLVDVDSEHIYFAAATNPLGSNPSENCQLFSIDRLGADLRQLTTFRERAHSRTGCYFGRKGQGCGIYPLQAQDPRSRALFFYSSCDPLGENPNAGQIFAIQPDGSGMRQLTNSRGLAVEADGTLSGELAGPWAYGPYVP